MNRWLVTMSTATLCCELVSGAACAQATATSGEVLVLTDAAERIRIAGQILEASKYDTQFERTASLMAVSAFDQGLKSELGDRYDVFPADLKSDLQRVLVEEVSRISKVILPGIRMKASAVYAHYFTVDELRQILRLQSDPAYQRMQQLIPQITTELGAIGLEAFSPHQDELEERVQAAIKNWQASNGKDVSS